MVSWTNHRRAFLTPLGLAAVLAGLILLPAVALAQNSAPIVDAGPDVTLFLFEGTVLNGSAVDPDGDPIVSWTWTIESTPSGSAPFLADPNRPDPVFLPDLVGAYVLSLVASDGLATSLPDTVTISVVLNQPPVAVATADVTSGVAPLTVSFDGSQSFDPEGGALVFIWTFGDGSLSSGEISPTHVFQFPGSFAAILAVIDDAGNSFSDSVLITVTDNQPPVAVDDSIEIEMNSINLIPAATFLANDLDPDGDPLAIVATCCAVNGSGGIDGPAQLVGFFPDEGFVGTASMMYQISDGALSSNLATITFIVLPPPDEDGDGIPDAEDACPGVASTGFDADNDGCIDSIQGLSVLIDTLFVEGVIDSTMQRSLYAKIDAALASLDRENVCTAINGLNSLKNQIEAQTGNKVSEDAAPELLQYITNVQNFLVIVSGVGSC